MSAVHRMPALAALLLTLGAWAQEAPDWNLAAPATQPPATAAATEAPQRRQRLMRPQAMQPPAQAADAAVLQGPSAAVPDGYQVMRAPPPPASIGREPVSQSHLPESSRPLDQQVDLLRRRVATLIQQMDELQARMVSGEQGLAHHTHAYSIPNMGFVSVETYQSYLDRQQRDGQPIPFFSGYANRTTTPPVMPR